ncbi:MAG: ABC transporter permease subunit [Euzebyales bacterium]|nr:ABC transporter permease subunit [Euzebyales bacterium]
MGRHPEAHVPHPRYHAAQQPCLGFAYCRSWRPTWRECGKAGILNLILAIVAIGWASYAGVVRGMVLSVREEAYVEAARALGASRLRILRRHISPHLVGPVVVLSTLDVGRMLLAVSALSPFWPRGRPPDA